VSQKAKTQKTRSFPFLCDADEPRGDKDDPRSDAGEPRGDADEQRGNRVVMGKSHGCGLCVNFIKSQLYKKAFVNVAIFNECY